MTRPDAGPALAGSPGLAAFDHGTLDVRAVHGNAMLTRLASVLGTHDVTSFDYDVADDGFAEVTVVVRGRVGQVDRAAARLLRVVGVVDVTRR